MLIAHGKIGATMDETRFTGMRVWRAVFPLRVSFSHNLATRSRIETLLVEIRASNGGVGFGQALPREYLTGESMESALEDIRERWWPELSRMAIPDSAGFTAAAAALEPLFEKADALRRNASYAALEMAALDAFAKGRGIPAGTGTVPADSRLPLVGVISAASPSRVAWLARIFRWLGYRRFKVKVGRDEAGDDKRLEAVRRAIGGDAWLAVDANAAWETDEAIRRMAGLQRFAVRLVEEPLQKSAAAAADFSELEKLAGIAVMADESLCTLGDAKALLARGSPSWWNLRVGKNGGFVGVSRLAEMARPYGINLYGGVLVGETSVLAAAGRAAMFSAGVECMEYGFPRVFLRGDPFRGGPGGFSGVLSPLSGNAAGLGVTMVYNALEKCAQLVWITGIS